MGGKDTSPVMRGLDPRIHVFLDFKRGVVLKTWIPVTSTGMTGGAT
jgi:hypothetical protein